LPISRWAVIFERMSDVSRVLSAIEQGDSSAADQLLPLVTMRRLTKRLMYRAEAASGKIEAARWRGVLTPEPDPPMQPPAK
jgi:hypothetical protein